MDVIALLHEVDEPMHGVCLCCTIREQHNYATLPCWLAPKESSGTVGARYVTELFQAAIEAFSVLRADYAVPPLTSQLPWPLHFFYINRFHIPTYNVCWLFFIELPSTDLTFRH